MLSHRRTRPKHRGDSAPSAPLPTPPTGGDKALPSDYTGGAGVTMQPRGPAAVN